MNKVLGIFALFLFVTVFTTIQNSNFLSQDNIENTLRWIGLRGVLSLGVMLVIITGGIDLSIGSAVALFGCLMPLFINRYEFTALEAAGLVGGAALVMGLLHGLLVTKLRLQPFIVTLCGLLIYRGIARFITDGQTQRFTQNYDELKPLVQSMPISLAELCAVLGTLAFFWALVFTGSRGPGHSRLGHIIGLLISFLCAALGGTVCAVQRLSEGRAFGIDVSGVAAIGVPMPFLILLSIAIFLGFFLKGTIYGRYLFALGQNETAARFSGISTGRWILLAYVLCSLLAALGGMLFAVNLNSVQPATHGSFYELYAIAAAVLAGCSLRGGEAYILGVLIATAVIQILPNSIHFLGFPIELEPAIIGLVILLGVTCDEIFRRVGRSRERARQLKAIQR